MTGVNSLPGSVTDYIWELVKARRALRGACSLPEASRLLESSRVAVKRGAFTIRNRQRQSRDVCPERPKLLAFAAAVHYSQAGRETRLAVDTSEIHEGGSHCPRIVSPNNKKVASVRAGLSCRGPRRMRGARGLLEQFYAAISRRDIPSHKAQGAVGRKDGERQGD